MYIHCIIIKIKIGIFAFSRNLPLRSRPLFDDFVICSVFYKNILTLYGISSIYMKPSKLRSDFSEDIMPRVILRLNTIVLIIRWTHCDDGWKNDNTVTKVDYYQQTIPYSYEVSTLLWTRNIWLWRGGFFFECLPTYPVKKYFRIILCKCNLNWTKLA